MALLLLLFLLLLGGFGLSMGTSSSSVERSNVDAVMAVSQLHGIRGQALAGARLYAESGCTNCHTYEGIGSANLGAPDLSAEGTKGHSIRYLVAKLRCPSCITRGSSMPQFAALGSANLQKVALFLAASKGGP